MEAASRPSLEPLPDLPVEAPLETPAAKAAAPAAPAATAGGSAPSKAEQTGITFLDPAALVLDTAEVPVISAPMAAAAPPVLGPATESELTLEDPIVDEMLTSPPPPPAVVKSAPPPAAAAPTAPVIPDSARTEARVPIARTGSLSTAATKLAAANRRTSEHSAPRSPSPAPVRPVPAAAPAAAPGGPAQAQGLAGWTSARAAATPSAPKPKASARARPPLPRRRRRRHRR